MKPKLHNIIFKYLDSPQKKLDRLKTLQTQIEAQLYFPLLPILDKAFKGEL